MPEAVVTEARKNKHHFLRGVVLVAALALISAGIYFTEKGSPTMPNVPVETALAMEESRPVRIEIPIIGVDAKVVELGLKPDRTIEIPDRAEDVGWYKYKETPGEIGPAVLVGHLDWTDGPAVFYNLGKLEVGNTIRITREDGSVAVFKVEMVQDYEQDDFPTEMVYGGIDHAGLRLITCSGRYFKNVGHYSHNLVVYASLVAGE